MAATTAASAAAVGGHRRTAAQVSANLERAKLCMDDMQPLAQAVFFHPQNNDDLLLIEVDEHLLDQINDPSSKQLVIRGDPDDALVLCSDSRTYLVREAGISNSLMVIPDLRLVTKDGPLTAAMSPSGDGLAVRQVMKSFHHYWEPRQIRPSARKLHSLLLESEYRGAELESETRPESLLTLAALLERVQASEGELAALVAELPVVEVDGFYRLLGFDYHFRVLEFILTSIESNSMPLDQIDIDTVNEEVSELEPREIVEGVLSWYVQPQPAEEADTPSTAKRLGVLCKDKVCRTHGEVLLRNGESFNLEQFLVTWQQSLPEGLTPAVSQLYGCAFVDEDKSRATIHYLSPWDLPAGEKARFEDLLRMKTCWRLEEIEPFVRDLSLKGVNSLLLKYARAFKKDGVALYSKK